MLKRRVELVVLNTNLRMCMLIDPNSVGRTQLIQIDVEFNMKSILQFGSSHVKFAVLTGPKIYNKQQVLVLHRDCSTIKVAIFYG